MTYIYITYNISYIYIIYYIYIYSKQFFEKSKATFRDLAGDFWLAPGPQVRNPSFRSMTTLRRTKGSKPLRLNHGPVTYPFTILSQLHIEKEVTLIMWSVTFENRLLPLFI